MGAIGTPLAFSELYIALQQGTVDGLSKENQEALLEAGRQFSEKWNNEVWPTATEEGLKVMKDNGVEILEVDKKLFSAKTQSVVDDFLKNASKGQKALYEALIAAR